jgi:hypothetical protein
VSRQKTLQLFEYSISYKGYADVGFYPGFFAMVNWSDGDCNVFCVSDVELRESFADAVSFRTGIRDDRRSIATIKKLVQLFLSV